MNNNQPGLFCSGSSNKSGETHKERKERVYVREREEEQAKPS